MICRLCNEKDLDLWIKMNKEFMAIEIQDESLWNYTKGVSYEVFVNTFKEAMENDNLIKLMLFEENNEVIGFANVMIIFSVWSHGKALILDDFYIRSEYRGKGYGKKALKSIEEYAIENKYKRLQFQANLENERAITLYKSMGYVNEDMKFFVKYFK